MGTEFRNMKTKKIITSLLKSADVKVGGSRHWDISVHNEEFYNRILTHGSLGLGEAYMDGWWETENLLEFSNKILRKKLQNKILNWHILIHVVPRIIWIKLFDFGSKKHSKNIGSHHYDIGNDIYKSMLDKRMVYTCGYWRNASNLDEAQEAKLDLICRKLNLKQGMKVLDIGCGWGSFLKFAAERYGVEGVGVTVSKNQKELGDELCRGLPIEIKLQDYREVEGKFDAIVSIGMFEHVGVKYYETFMKKTHELLKEDGLFLLHTIGADSGETGTDQWIDKYIFPGGMIPSLEQMSHVTQKFFVMEDWHNFGYDYYLTLREWYKNFDEHWLELEKTGKYNKRFYRMWKYYLLMTAGAFKARHVQLWQIVLSKKGVDGRYTSVR